METQIDKFKQDIDELRTQNSKLESTINSLSESVASNFDHRKDLQFLIDRQQQYSRKNSIRITGVMEEPGENIESKSISILKNEIDVDINSEEIEIVHHVSRAHDGHPRSILVKFLSHKTKESVMRRKKNARNVKIYEDLAPGIKTPFTREKMERFRLERFQTAPKLVAFTRGFGNGSKRLQKLLQWRRECAATNYVITGAKFGCSPFEYFFVKMAAKNTKKLYTWTEEETALLLKVVLDYKTATLAIAQDWETIRFKYDDLAKRLIEAYPNEVTDEFPWGQTKETFSAAKVSSKVKKLKNSFSKALDTGRKSGGAE